MGLWESGKPVAILWQVCSRLFPADPVIPLAGCVRFGKMSAVAG